MHSYLNVKNKIEDFFEYDLTLYFKGLAEEYAKQKINRKKKTH